MSISLTPEQQVAFDAEVRAAARTAEHEQQLQLESNRARLEAVRFARDTLTDNRRTMPANTPGITATEITAFADTLVTYIVR
jgi:hypothetical protein